MKRNPLKDPRLGDMFIDRFGQRHVFGYLGIGYWRNLKVWKRAMRGAKFIGLAPACLRIPQEPHD